MPLVSPSDLVHVLLKMRDRHLHHFSGLQHEGELHLAGAEQFADDFHACQQVIVDDDQRLVLGACLFEGFDEVFLFAIDDVFLKALFKTQIRRLRRSAISDLILIKQIDENLKRILRQRTIFEFNRLIRPAVVNQFDGGSPLRIRNASSRQNLRGMHNRTGQACFGEFMHERTIEHHARRWFQPEADIGKPNRRLTIGKLRSDSANTFDRLQRRPAILVHASGNRQHQRIKKDVLFRQTIFVHRHVAHASGNRFLAIRSASHRLFGVFIDGAKDESRAIRFRQSHHLCEFFFAIFKIGRVDDALATRAFEASFNDRRLSGIEHERSIHLAHETMNDVRHVLRIISTGIIDIHIDHMRAFARLLARQADHAIPVFFFQEFFEGPRTGGIGALADVQNRSILPIFDRRVER